MSITEIMLQRHSRFCYVCTCQRKFLEVVRKEDYRFKWTLKSITIIEQP